MLEKPCCLEFACQIGEVFLAPLLAERSAARVYGKVAILIHGSDIILPVGRGVVLVVVSEGGMEHPVVIELVGHGELHGKILSRTLIRPRHGEVGTASDRGRATIGEKGDPVVILLLNVGIG